jgi:transposase
MSANDATTGHELTDRQWARLAPLPPAHRPPKGSKGGKPFVDHRRVLNGLLWLDRTGAVLAAFLIRPLDRRCCARGADGCKRMKGSDEQWTRKWR